jgi:hypothetical protein
MERLDAVSPRIVECLRDASPETLRSTAIAACEFALSRVIVPYDIVSEAMDALRRQPMARERFSTKLAALAERLDQDYFELHAAAGERRDANDEWLTRFHQARAATAVAYACDEDAWTAAVESIYEAAMAIPESERDALFKLVETRIAKV